jgi:transcriptional regulator
MHNLSEKLHKPSLLRKLQSNEPKDEESNDYEHQDRLAKVLNLHSQGYSQSEIAKKLNVNQSTVSRDLGEIKKKARGSLDLYVKEEIPNEFQLYISGLNQIMKNLWEIVSEKESKITVKDRTYVLSLLMQCYSRRIEMLVGGPEDKMNARKHINHIHHNEKFVRY